MEEKQVARVLRDFIVPRVPDEDVDYVEYEYRHMDLDQLFEMAERVAKDEGVELSTLFE